jgi:RNA polymerase sigma-70 factor, ECF subfamily
MDPAMHAAIADNAVISVLSGCQRGEKAAIEGLYDLYADRLYRYLLARTGEPEVAADLTGELFLRVMKHIGHFKMQADCPAASLSAWLYRIAGNLVTDYYRQQGRRHIVDLDEQESLPAHEPDPQAVVESQESYARLAAALGELTEEQRLVVLGKFGEGMSNGQVAAWLGKTEGAVEGLQHRALRALGRILTGKRSPEERA